MNKFRTYSVLAAAAVLVLGVSGVAHATASNGIGGMGDQLRDQIGSLTDLVGAAAFVVGLVFGASGLMKFKQHSDNPQGNPLSHAMTRLLVAGALVSLPAILGTSIGTLFGGATTTTNSNGGALTGINRQ